MSLFNDSYSSLFNPDALISPYGRYTIEVEYVTDVGVLQIPTAPFGADPGIAQAAAFVAVHNPYTYKIVRFLGERLASFPISPYPDSNNSNYVLLHARIQTLSPKPTTDGTNLIYRIGGEYIYGAVLPQSISDTTGVRGVNAPASDGLTIPIQNVPESKFNRKLEY